MLQVEANAIANEAFAHSLALLEREMDIVLQHLTNLGTEAALISGFVFVIFTNEIPIENEALAMLSMAFSTACFGAMVYVVVCATISCSLGPMLALKGNDPSAMRRAVEEMKHDRRRIVLAFTIGMGSFGVLPFILLWNRLLDYLPGRLYNGVVCSCIMAIAGICLVVSVRRMVQKYHIDESVSIAQSPGGSPAQVTGKEYLKRVGAVRKAEAAGSDTVRRVVSSGGV